MRNPGGTMPLIRTMSAKARSGALVAITALTYVGVAGAQVTTSTSASAAPRSAAARARCAGCSDSSQRFLYLRLRIDSLRSELFEGRRLTAVENDALEREMAATVRALQSFFEAGVRTSVQADVRRSTEAAAMAMSLQSGRVRGYLGVIFDGPSTDIITDRDRIIRFYQYPRIASVDPSSPAERAGVIIGDTVLAFNGIDVLDRAFSLSKMLIPDEKFTMKVLRRGDPKEFRIVVGEAPAYAVARAMPWPPSAAMAPDAPVGGVVPGAAVAPAPPVRVRGGTRVPAPPAPGMPPESPDAPVVAAYPGRVSFLGNAVAGARLEALNAGNEALAKALGAKEGLLVVRVSPGTLAERSGIRDGDVILRAGGETILTVQDFARVVSDRYRSDEGVKVVVLRDRKQKDLVLK